MSDLKIKDGTGKNGFAKVTSDNRLLGDVIREPISAERSRQGKLWGLGTGNLTLSGSMSLGSVLWFQNNGSVNDWYIQKLIFGWNGGSTTFNRTVLSFVKYQSTVPTGLNTSISAAIENISRSGPTTPVVNADFVGHKWDGSSTGMTGGTGGYLQIPNRIAQGDTEKPINGEIILGPSDTMEILVTPEEAGEFHVSVVFYEVAAGQQRGDE